MSGEIAFIDALRRLATDPGARGFDDDCAVIPVGGEELVLTHDVMAEGVHYLPEQDPADVAWKLISVNLSDLAAKGADPMGVLLGYMLGDGDARFLKGLEEALNHYGVPLLGGDTISRAGPQVLGLTAIGRATHRPVPSRSGAREGDDVYLTGPVGAAMLGYETLKAGSTDSSAYCRPLARLAEGQALAPVITAMMDVSDGLLLDASRMAKASGVTIDIDSASVPIAAPEARRNEAMRWGDDYELLFTVPAGASLPVPATRIGRVSAASGVTLIVDGASVAPDDRLGFEH